jgi:hypothetical protein
MAVKPRLVLIVSDLHCGSTVGLMHPDCVVTDDDGEKAIPQRPYQRWLWQCWLDMIETTGEVIGKDPHHLVVNGDVVEGIHHGGRQVVSDNPKHHGEIAWHCLNPIAERAEGVYIVRGTECHVKNDEHHIAEKLAAVKDKETGLRVWDHLPLRMNGLLLSFRHHISATARNYLEAGALSVHLGHEQLECQRSGWPVPNIIVRAHRHRHGEYTDGVAMTLVTAAWQGETRHVHKAVVGAVSRPSWILLDWRGRGEGDLPAVHRRIYRPPYRGEQC